MKKVILILISIFTLMNVNETEDTMRLTDLLDIEGEVTEITLYKRVHRQQMFGDEIEYIKVIELRDREEILNFLNKLEEIIVFDDPHICDRFGDCDFDNNYIYVKINGSLLIFVEDKEVRPSVEYAIKNKESVRFIFEYFN